MKKIYTKTGDSGRTSMIGGEEISKSSIYFETLGTIDELNANLGALFASTENSEIRKLVRWIQEKLNLSMAMIASGNKIEEADDAVSHAKITAKDVTHLEVLMESFGEKLPELREFISQGDTLDSAQAHICRAVCRRAERRLVALKDTVALPSSLIPFFNRLSDLLFIIARVLTKN